MHETKVIFEPSSHSRALSSVQMNVKGRPRARSVVFVAAPPAKQCRKTYSSMNVICIHHHQFCGPKPHQKNHSTIPLLASADPKGGKSSRSVCQHVFLELRTPINGKHSHAQKTAHNSETSEEKTTSKRIQVESQSVLFALSASS